jgi:hypothetical protein
MPELMQDTAVTFVALGAAAMILRRFAALFRQSARGSTACASCPSACTRPAGAAAPPEAPVPIQLFRR